MKESSTVEKLKPLSATTTSFGVGISWKGKKYKFTSHGDFPKLYQSIIVLEIEFNYLVPEGLHRRPCTIFAGGGVQIWCCCWWWCRSWCYSPPFPHSNWPRTMTTGVTVTGTEGGRDWDRLRIWPANKQTENMVNDYVITCYSIEYC